MGAPPGRARRAASSTTGASSTAVPHPANTSFPPKSWSSALDPWLSSTSRSTAYNGASTVEVVLLRRGTNPRRRLTRRRGCRRLASVGCYLQNVRLTDGSKRRVVHALISFTISLYLILLINIVKVGKNFCPNFFGTKLAKDLFERIYKYVVGYTYMLVKNNNYHRLAGSI
ncbi:hypothetical protein PVAP13_5NG515500 [Panicum virgatum]|uniref:Uncharacterized protein n=1 Tax=Panicum virgatum TaxID=38727 RepID=A0A8T0RZ79_PANVG|nr:hypothetical protein PVAP13_5NG515500 [Panicum virgatum]